MIPYFQFTHFNIGPIAIQVWGLCVAIGIIAAVTLMHKMAKKYVLSPDVVVDMALWILVAAFLGARFFHVVFYEPEYYVRFPLDIIKVWQGGLSSLGGFIGAVAGVWLFAKKRKFSWHELLPYFDITALGLWLGWGFGRIGCFLIHDHPGRLSNFMLAVQYPGGARFDLGLLESILGFLLFTLYSLLFATLVKKHWGLTAQLSILSYAVARFFLDFLRARDLPASDVRYWSLTPAQWGMAVVVIALTGWIVYGKIAQRKENTTHNDK